MHKLLYEMEKEMRGRAGVMWIVDDLASKIVEIYTKMDCQVKTCGECPAFNVKDGMCVISQLRGVIDRFDVAREDSNMVCPICASEITVDRGERYSMPSGHVIPRQLVYNCENCGWMYTIDCENVGE